MEVQQFITLWSASGASERANKDSYLKDLADVLGVPHPAPCTGDRARDTYVFEADALVPHEGGAVSIGKMDLYKAECFVLEAKQGSHAGAAKVGTARRNTPSWSIAMQDAYGQALNYARTLPKPPPFLVVADIGYCFDLYASFDDSGIYRPYTDGQSARLFLADLPRHRDTLRAIWTDPHSLDPARQKARVTREIAGHIAELASALEDAGHKAEVVAKFLMRALFTMFAEDVGLLPEGMFTRALADRWCKEPGSFPGEVEELWTKMNTGGSLFGAGRILQFNGGLFSEPKALPLDATQLRTLLAAAKCSWADVEPAIFGTLLERALDDRERHALGAHYTPPGPTSSGWCGRPSRSRYAGSGTTFASRPDCSHLLGSWTRRATPSAGSIVSSARFVCSTRPAARATSSTLRWTRSSASRARCWRCCRSWATPRRCSGRACPRRSFSGSR